MRGFRHHRRGQHPPGESPLSVERIPVFSFWNGELHCRYNRNPIEWATKEGEVLTEGDRQALDYFDAVVARPGFALAMELERGDMQFIANFAILHRSEEQQSELQSLMRISYAVFCLKNNKYEKHKQ